MGKWTTRLALGLWVALYFFLINPVGVSFAVYYLLGWVLFWIISYVVFVAWSLVFYFLLSREGSIDQLGIYLDGIKKKQADNWFFFLLAKISSFFEGILRRVVGLLGVGPSIYLIFLLSGPLFGVVAVKADQAAGLRLKMLMIALGCVLSVIGETVLVGAMVGFFQTIVWIWGWLSAR